MQVIKTQNPVAELLSTTGSYEEMKVEKKNKPNFTPAKKMQLSPKKLIVKQSIKGPRLCLNNLLFFLYCYACPPGSKNGFP